MHESAQRIGIASLLMMRAARHVNLDPADVIRAWPRVTLAAHHLAQALDATETSAGRAIEQIAIDAFSMARSNTKHDWPGPGSRDQELLKVAMSIEAAAQAVPDDRDIDATATLLSQTLSVLWIGSEYTRSAAMDAANDVEFDRDLGQQARIRVAARARDTARRLDAAERIAGEFIGARPGHGTGSVSEGLVRAIATWDVEAHRALIFDRSTMVLHGLARMEAMTGAAFGEFVANAERAGHLDELTAQRMTPALESLPRSWDAVGDATADLAFSNTSIPREFIEAAENLRTELDRAVDFATPDEQAATLGAIKSHAATSMAIASSAQDLLMDDELRAPARAVARALATANPGRIDSPVDPTDIQRRMTVPLPKEARDHLQGPVGACVLDAHELVRRTAGLEAPSAAPLGAVGITRPRSEIRPIAAPAASPTF